LLIGLVRINFTVFHKTLKQLHGLRIVLWHTKIEILQISLFSPLHESSQTLVEHSKVLDLQHLLANFTKLLKECLPVLCWYFDWVGHPNELSHNQGIWVVL